MCGDVRAGPGKSPAGAKESRLAREGGGAGLWSEGPTVRTRSPCPCALLLSAGKGGWSFSTTSIAKLKRARAWRKMTLIPNYPPKPLALGGPVCLCNVCACRSLCACLLSRTVSFVLLFLSSPPRLPLSCGPLSSGEKAVFQVSKDGERCPGCTGVGFGVLAREGGP